MLEALQWAIGVIVTLQVGVMGFFATRLWEHVAECRQLIARLEGISKDVERMKEDIGTHDTGIRGSVHKVANLAQGHELRLANLERR